MVELFRFELIEAMYKEGVLTSEIANNLMSWRHSGFHVHATAPFEPCDDDGKLLRNRLAYAFRPAVSLNRLSFDGKRVRYRSRRQRLDFTPVEFLARLTLHIPDRYQNIRRYAGFYSSPVQRRVRAVRWEGARVLGVEEGRAVKPSWAKLIARIFGAIPVECPRCGNVMELKEFILDDASIERFFPDLARAPPRKEFERLVPNPDEPVYGIIDDDSNYRFDQTRPDDDLDFNQACPELVEGDVEG